MKTSKTKILNRIVRMVCEKEGGRKKLDAPQAREVIRIIATLIFTDAEFDQLMYNYGFELTEKKAKKKK